MSSHYQVIIEQDEDGVYVGTVAGLPSCYSDGKTIQELLKNMQEVIPLCERQLKKSQKNPHNQFIGVRDLVLQHA